MYVETVLLSTHSICFSLQEHEMLKVSYCEKLMYRPSYLPKIALKVNSYTPPSILTKIHRDNDHQRNCSMKIKSFLWQYIIHCRGTEGIIKKLHALSCDPYVRKSGIKTVAFLFG